MRFAKLALVLIFFAAIPAIAFAQDGAAEPSVSAPDFSEFWSLIVTYPGLLLATVGLVEYLKVRIKSGVLDGNEHFAALVLVPGFGAAAKALGWAYANVPWAGHVATCLILGGLVAGKAHDLFLNPILGKKVPGGK